MLNKAVVNLILYLWHVKGLVGLEVLTLPFFAVLACESYGTVGSPTCLNQVYITKSPTSFAFRIYIHRRLVDHIVSYTTVQWNQ